MEMVQVVCFMHYLREGEQNESLKKPEEQNLMITLSRTQGQKKAGTNGSSHSDNQLETQASPLTVRRR